MRKLYSLVAIFLVLAACKNNTTVPEAEVHQDLEFNYQKMPKKFELSPEVVELIEGWEAFKALLSSFDVLYKAKNNEDLRLAIKDLIEKELLLEQSVYPGILNDLQIKSRQRVLKTYFLKVQASIENNLDTTTPTIEMLEAYNAFRRQFNVVVSSQLDEKLLLNEQ